MDNNVKRNEQMNNKTVLITGGTSGLGRACVDVFLEAVWNVATITPGTVIAIEPFSSTGIGMIHNGPALRMQDFSYGSILWVMICSDKTLFNLFC